MNARPASVDEYLSQFPGDVRAALENLRRQVKALAPSATEVFSYGMPGFKYMGRPLVAFAAWKAHIALYGVNAEEHRDLLAPFDTSPKGTIRFPPGEPIPESVVTALLRTRMAAIEKAAAARKHGRQVTGVKA